MIPPFCFIGMQIHRRFYNAQKPAAENASGRIEKRNTA